MHCREQEVQVDLKGTSSKNEELGYLLIKLKIESGMTSISQKSFMQQNSLRVNIIMCGYCNIYSLKFYFYVHGQNVKYLLAIIYYMVRIHTVM